MCSEVHLTSTQQVGKALVSFLLVQSGDYDYYLWEEILPDGGGQQRILHGSVKIETLEGIVQAHKRNHGLSGNKE